MERALKLDKWVCVCAGNIQSMAQVNEHVGGGGGDYLWMVYMYDHHRHFYLAAQLLLLLLFFLLLQHLAPVFLRHIESLLHLALIFN